jgi:hypothetical protein
MTLSINPGTNTGHEGQTGFRNQVVLRRLGACPKPARPGGWGLTDE